MMNQRDDEFATVDALLAQARNSPPQVPDALMARVLADAQAAQPEIIRSMPETQDLWARFCEVFGGWQGMGGMVAATCAGVWIGLSPPETLPDAGVLLFGYETTDVSATTAELTSFGWDLDEG